MEIQYITNVVSIHKSITSLTHLIDHSYCQAWSALLAAAILKMHLYFYIATDPTSIWVAKECIWKMRLYKTSSHFDK